MEIGLLTKPPVPSAKLDCRVTKLWKRYHFHTHNNQVNNTPFSGRDRLGLDGTPTPTSDNNGTSPLSTVAEE
jgi:hypothetical protein